MAESFNEATFGFRFMALSPDELQRLQELMPKVIITARARGESSVVSSDITEGFDLDALCMFIRESGVDPKMYSLWISLVAAMDQGGIAVPEHILAVIRRTSGGVDFSFVSCLGNDSSLVP
jgi:hypothetical protein